MPMPSGEDMPEEIDEQPVPKQVLEHQQCKFTYHSKQLVPSFNSII